MIRRSLPMSLWLASGLSLSAWPAVANVQLIHRGNTTSTRTETRLVATPQTEQATGAKQLTDAKRKTETQITGPLTMLVKEWETQTYQIPVTTYPLQREERREIKTTTTRYLRRTTHQVPSRSWNTWIVGSPLANGMQLRADLVQAHPYHLNPEARDSAWPYLAQARIERSQAHYNPSNAIAVLLNPYPGSGHLQSLLYFDKNLNFIKGLIGCHPRTFAKIPTARVIRYGDHDAIEYRLNCVNNEDWNPFNHCGTGDNTWTLHLQGRLLASRVDTAYRTEVRDQPYTSISNRTGPWAPTGRMVRGKGTTRYENGQETVLVGQRIAPHSKALVTSLTAAPLGGRRLFTGDSGSEGRAMLSSGKVRQALGADRVMASSARRSAGQAPGTVRPLDPSAPSKAARPIVKASDSWKFPGKTPKPNLRKQYDAFRREVRKP